MSSPETVQADSLLTLHYCVTIRNGEESASCSTALLRSSLTSADNMELVSTFGSSPATLQLGSGELAPPLEQCLIGVGVGERRVFLLEADQAFGAHNPQLVQRLPRSELPADHLPELHGTIEFRSANGAQFTGIVRELDADGLLVDFNHPLAGKPIRFEVEIKGIL